MCKSVIFVYYLCRNYLKKILRIWLKNQLVICTLPDLWDILLYSVDVVHDELLLLW